MFSKSIQCNVCQTAFGAPVYQTVNGRSITTLRRFLPSDTRVYFCEKCGHVQTQEIEDLKQYYAESYDLLLGSAEEDELYQIRDGKPVFRFDHEVAVLLSKVDLIQRPLILDFGCGKGAVLGKLRSHVPALQPHFFDVSPGYRPFWEKISPPECGAVFEIPEDWNGKFDLITSFFSLEHVSAPVADLERIHALLKPEGLFYFIVPNLFSNRAEMIVVDHINHFSLTSLEYLLKATGFEAVEVDAHSHEGGIIVVARKGRVESSPSVSGAQVAQIRSQVQGIAHYWSTIGERVRRFEGDRRSESKVGVYGAGFYGAFLASQLQNPEKVVGFFDRDPHKWGKTLLDKEILDPATKDEEVGVVYVALNPDTAQASIASVEAWKGKGIEYFFL